MASISRTLSHRSGILYGILYDRVDSFVLVREVA
jgi:hypothetical protein